MWRLRELWYDILQANWCMNKSFQHFMVKIKILINRTFYHALPCLTLKIAIKSRLYKKTNQPTKQNKRPKPTIPGKDRQEQHLAFMEKFIFLLSQLELNFYYLSNYLVISLNFPLGNIENIFSSGIVFQMYCAWCSVIAEGLTMFWKTGLEILNSNIYCCWAA